jgi:hypothetical protein
VDSVTNGYLCDICWHYVEAVSAEIFVDNLRSTKLTYKVSGLISNKLYTTKLTYKVTGRESS